MADLHRQRLEDRMTDAALTFLMDEYAEADGMRLLSLFEASGVTMPEVLNLTCKKETLKYSRESEKHALLRRTVHRAAKTAAVLVVVCSLSVNLIMSVEALRVPCLNFLIDTGKRISSISFGSGHKDQDSSLDYASPIPFFIPDGFQLIAAENNHENKSMLFKDSNLMYLFKNDAGHMFQIVSIPAHGSLSIDTENAECREMELCGMQALYIKKDGLRMLWLDPDLQRVYDIYTNGMEETAFLEYAETLAKTIQAAEFATE